MILTDREIQIVLQKKQIEIFPEPDLDLYSSTSVDLRLGDRLTVFSKDINDGPFETIIDPTKSYNAESAIRKVSTEHTIDDAGFVLAPHQFVLGFTMERVNLPMEARLAARVEGKSSLARLGLLIHFTAPTIHSGFNNLIRLEMLNLGTVPIRLRKGMRICQLIIELTFGTPDKAFKAVQTS